MKAYVVRYGKKYFDTWDFTTLTNAILMSKRNAKKYAKMLSDDDKIQCEVVPVEITLVEE